MKINLENYEAYFIDYIEGKLDDNTVNELKDFIAVHPDLQNILEQYTGVLIPADTISFNEKTILYKFKFNTTPVNINTYNDFCIAYYENLLNDSKKNELLQFIETNPEFKNNFLLYKKTFLQQEVIVYPDRKKLYKKNITKKPMIQMYWWGSIAAGIVIIFGLYFGFLRNKDYRQTNVANKSEIPNKNTNNIEEKVTKNELKNSQIENHSVPYLPGKYIYKKKTLATNTNSSFEKDANIEPLRSLPPKLLTNSNNFNYPDLADVTTYENINPLVINEKDTSPLIYDLDRKRYFLLTLVETSFNQLNKISGTDIADVSFKTDRSGKITAYSFKAGFIEFHRNLEK